MSASGGHQVPDSLRVDDRDEKSPSVTVAILNYNGRALLEVVLRSLADQTYQDFETVVIDDCSSDDSVEYLESSWPDVAVVGTGARNIGVAAALNLAVRTARGSLVALLNNDIELEPNWLKAMVGALEDDSCAGSAACKLRNYHRRDELDGAGDIFTLDGIPSRRGHGEVDDGQYDDASYVFAPTAGAALYRASVLADVGPFDESFFAYYEDVDWGLRAQLRGYRCLYVPNAVGYHIGSATTGGTHNPFYFQLMRRNLFALPVKDLPATFLLRNGPRLLGAQLLLVRESARAGMLATHLGAIAALPRMIPGWLHARREIMRGRKITGSELAHLMCEWQRSIEPR